MLGVGDGIPSRPCRFEIKVFPTARQTYILDTDIAPGANGNEAYWDANFIMGLELGYPADNDVHLYYRDTIELLYDGLE